MSPKTRRRNAAAAKDSDTPTIPLRRSKRINGLPPTPIENERQAGPERFAPWYPLLQKVKRDAQLRNGPNRVPVGNNQAEEMLGEEFGDIFNHIHRAKSVAPKVFDNHLVPPNEYPAVQLRNGVLTLNLSRPPRNLGWLQRRLKSARHVADWPTGKWQSYMIHSYMSTTKEAVMVEMMALFQTFPDQPEYTRTFCQRFDDFPEYAPFSRGIEKPCPGFAQGFGLEAYPCVNVEYLSAAVCVTHPHASLVHPHLAGDFICGDVNDLEAVSARHGAALVYMRNVALDHIRADTVKDMADIMTFTTNGTYINFFAHYASTSAEGRVEYHQYHIASVNLMGSYLEFIQGVTMLRNCQDHALFMATGLRDQLEKYHVRHGTNAWAYHPDEGEDILSEDEDSELEDGEYREYGSEDTTGRGIAGENVRMHHEISSDDDRNNTDDTDYDEDSPAQKPLRALNLVKVGPKTRAARMKEQQGNVSRKRRAGESHDESPRKRRR